VNYRYPILLKTKVSPSSNPTVVFFSKGRHGVVVLASLGIQHHFGYESHFWTMEDFEYFDGPVTLCNESEVR